MLNNLSLNFSTIAFDADDTLWENEAFFRLTQARFAELLQEYTEPDHLAERLLDAERRNLGRYGFGIKGFVLSMIETAIDVTQAQVSAQVIQQLIEAGKTCSLIQLIFYLTWQKPSQRSQKPMI